MGAMRTYCATVIELKTYEMYILNNFADHYQIIFVISDLYAPSLRTGIGHIRWATNHSSECHRL